MVSREVEFFVFGDVFITDKIVIACAAVYTVVTCGDAIFFLVIFSAFWTIALAYVFMALISVVVVNVLTPVASQCLDVFLYSYSDEADHH